MNVNDHEIERVWRSPRNTPDVVGLAAAQARFLADLARRRRGRRLFLVLVLGALTLISARVVLSVWLHEGVSDMEFTRDWASLLFLAIPWLGLGLLMRRVVRHERAYPAKGNSIREILWALLDEIAMARAHFKVVAGLLASTLVLLPLVVWQLRATGKAGDEILWPAFIGWPLIAGTILSLLWWYDRFRLRPRQRQLETLRREYEREE